MSIMFFHALLILCLGWVYPRSLLIGTDYNIYHFSFLLLLAGEPLRIPEQNPALGYSFYSF
jgi:hypothetical protein